MQPLHTTPNDNNLGVLGRKHRPRARSTRVSLALHPGRRSPLELWQRLVRGDAESLAGVQMLLTRETPEGTPAGGWIPNERLTLEEAIQGYTMGGAFAARREKTEGSIEVGKLADVIIISQDLFKIAPNQIGKTKVTDDNGRRQNCLSGSFMGRQISCRFKVEHSQKFC